MENIEYKETLDYTEEEKKKFSSIKKGTVTFSLRKRKKEFTNKEIDKLNKQYNIDIMSIMQRMNENIEASFILIYLGTNLSNLKVTLNDYIKYFEDKTPSFKIEFIAANAGFVEIAAEKMGFTD